MRGLYSSGDHDPNTNIVHYRKVLCENGKYMRATIILVIPGLQVASF